MKSYGILTILVALAASCGCNSATTVVKGPANDAGSDAGSDAAVADAGKPPAPGTLLSFESNAEGIGDACISSDFAKARGILGEASSNWPNVRPLAAAQGASPTTLSKIDDALAKIAADLSNKQSRACEEDANVISFTVADLFDRFAFAVPSDALRADAAFRQLQIDGEYSDFAATTADLAKTKEIWARLKPLTAAQAPKRGDVPGASSVVGDLDAAVQACQSAIASSDATALGNKAQAGLDLVDTVETIFK